MYRDIYAVAPFEEWRMASAPNEGFELLARAALIFSVSGAFGCYGVSERKAIDNILGLISRERISRNRRAATAEQDQDAKTNDATSLAPVETQALQGIKVLQGRRVKHYPTSQSWKSINIFLVVF